MKTVDLIEAKRHLSALVTEASNGETIVIMRNGELIAKLSPISRNRKKCRETTIERMRTLRARLKGPKISARELIDDGRRYGG